MTAATTGRGVFDVDPDRAVAELERAWEPAGYHGFGFDAGQAQWSAITNAGEILTGATPDELSQKIRAHWQAIQ